MDRARREALKAAAAGLLGLGLGLLAAPRARAAPAAEFILGGWLRLPAAVVYENDGNIVAVAPDGAKIDEGSSALASAIENFDHVIVHGFIDVGSQTIQLPEDPRRMKVIHGSGQAVIYGTIRVEGGELNDTYGLIDLERVFVVSPEDTTTPALHMVYPRRTILRDIILATSDVNAPAHNLMPSTMPNPGTVGLRLETQSGEQTILENIIATGHETAFDIVSADHLLADGLESRFCSRYGFRLGAGFDYNVRNMHSFNCGGDEIVMLYIDDIVNAKFGTLHDENCQSVSCNTRITIDMPDPNRYILFDAVYVSGDGDHILLRTGYRSWARFIEIRHAWISGATGNLIVQGTNDGPVSLGRFATIHGTEIPRTLVNREYDAIVSSRGVKSWTGTLTSSPTTAATLGAIDNQYRPGFILASVYAENQDTVDHTVTIEVDDGDTVSKATGTIPAGSSNTVTTIHYYAGSGYKVIYVRVYGDADTANVSLRVTAAWIRLPPSIMWP